MSREYKSLTEEELQFALDHEFVGAESEFSFRRWLESHPTISRDSALSTLGEAKIPSNE